jgi:hypothetical protein
MHGLDGEAPHVTRLKLQVNVVGLGAQRRLAGVLDGDGEIVGSVCWRNKAERRKENADPCRNFTSRRWRGEVEFRAKRSGAMESG